MKSDIYLKAVLTVIAVMLTVIATSTLINPVRNPPSVKAQQRPDRMFDNLQVSSNGNGDIILFDPDFTQSVTIYSLDERDGHTLRKRHQWRLWNFEAARPSDRYKPGEPAALKDLLTAKP